MRCAVCPADVKPHAFDLATEIGSYKCPACGTEWEMHFETGSQKHGTTQEWLVTHEDGGEPGLEQTLEKSWDDACQRLGCMVRDAARKVVLGEWEPDVQAFSAGADHQHPSYPTLKIGHINVTVTFEPPACGTDESYRNEHNTLKMMLYGEPQHGETRYVAAEPDVVIDNVSGMWHGNRDMCNTNVMPSALDDEPDWTGREADMVSVTATSSNGDHESVEDLLLRRKEARVILSWIRDSVAAFPGLASDMMFTVRCDGKPDDM